MALVSPTVLRWLVRSAGYGAELLGGYLISQLSEHVEQSDLVWRRVNVEFSPSGGITQPSDRAMFTLDIINLTSGAVDTSWTTGDYTAVETRLNTYMGTVMSNTGSGWTHTGYRWYVRSFNAIGNPKPFQPNGGPVRFTAANTAAGGGSTGVRQWATAVTEHTALPKHWGRWYLPSPGNTSLVGGGRYTTTYVDAMVTAANTLRNGLATDGNHLVVPVTQVNKQPFRGLLAVNGIQVDDVPDIIRRRRPASVNYRNLNVT